MPGFLGDDAGRGAGRGSRAAATLVSKNAFDIGLREVVADVEEATGMFFRQCIGEAVAEVQGGWVHASAPARINLADPPRCSRRDGNDLATEPIDQPSHLCS